MKSINKIIILLVLVNLSLCQSNAQSQTPIKDSLNYNSNFGPVFSLSSINGEAAYMLGGRGSFGVGDKISFGATFYFTLNTLTGNEVLYTQTSEIIRRKFLLMIGGVDVEYKFISNRYIKYSFQLLFGPGLLLFQDDDNNWKNNTKGFKVISPSLNATFALTNYLEIGIGIGYRFVFGIDSRHINNSDLQSLNVKLFALLGTF